MTTRTVCRGSLTMQQDITGMATSNQWDVPDPNVTYGLGYDPRTELVYSETYGYPDPPYIFTEYDRYTGAKTGRSFESSWSQLPGHYWTWAMSWNENTQTLWASSLQYVTSFEHTVAEVDTLTMTETGNTFEPDLIGAGASPLSTTTRGMAYDKVRDVYWFGAWDRWDHNLVYGEDSWVCAFNPDGSFVDGSLHRQSTDVPWLISPAGLAISDDCSRLYVLCNQVFELNWIVSLPEFEPISSFKNYPGTVDGGVYEDGHITTDNHLIVLGRDKANWYDTRSVFDVAIDGLPNPRTVLRGSLVLAQDVTK